MPEKITYSEPGEYFPKSLRIKYKLGEYAENEPEKEPESDKKETDK